MAIVAHDFIDGARANFITDGTQFRAMSKDGIFKRSLFVVVPFTIGIAGLCALPLEPGVVKVSGGKGSGRAQ